MKKSLLLFAAALAVASCTAEMDFDPVMPEESATEASGIRTVHFNAIQTDTKAQFGTPVNGSYPTLWTANDQKVKLSLNYGSAIEADVTPTSDFSNASFDAEFNFSGVTGPYTFYSVSPSSAAYALSPSREAWKVRIPCEQTPSASSVDEAGIILAASSIEFADAVDIQNVDLQFCHLTAYGRMSLSNLNLASGETVSAVELTATTPIVGDWYWETSGTTITDYGASSTLTINTSRTSDIWFACAPVDVGGEMMYLRVYTSKGSYEQIVEFPSGRSFVAGRTAVFTVNMSGADFTEAGSGTGTGAFELVTDASTLQAGDEVLIVYTAGSKSMGASAGNYRNPVDVTISNGAIASTGDAVVLTLAAGSTSGTWALKDGSNYLTSPSSGTNNYLLNSSTVSANSSWSVSITSAGAATIVASAGSRTYLRYNTNNPRFSCYQSSSVNNTVTPSIYRRTSASAGPDPLLAESAYGCYLGTGYTRTLDAGIDQVTRSYDQYGFETYTLIDPSDVEELEITGYKRGYIKGDGFPVTVNWRRGTTTVLSQNYSMTIIKEEGPKVWLSDGTHGVIIKK